MVGAAKAHYKNDGEEPISRVGNADQWDIGSRVRTPNLVNKNDSEGVEEGGGDCDDRDANPFFSLHNGINSNEVEWRIDERGDEAHDSDPQRVDT